MSFSELTEAALGHITETLGEEVTYTSAGGSTETLNGVFNARTEVIEGDTAILSSQPSLLIRLSDLSQDPAIGDAVTVREVAYKVHDIDKDGEGGAVLLLHKAT